MSENKIHFEMLMKFCGVHDNFDLQKDGKTWKEIRTVIFSSEDKSLDKKSRFAIVKEKSDHPYRDFTKEQLKQAQIFVTADASLIQHTIDEYIAEGKLTPPDNENEDEESFKNDVGKLLKDNKIKVKDLEKEEE